MINTLALKAPRSFWMILLFASLWLANPAHAATYNVTTYGATGNGTTDDSQAIANAIAAANAAAGNTVLFPAGTYLIGSASPKLQPKSITLQGGTNVVLNMTDSNAQIVAGSANTSFDGLTISNTGSDKNSGLVFSTAKNGSVTNCTFNGWVNGIRANGSSGLKVKQNSFFMPKRETGILLQNASTATISKNKFASNSAGYGYGIFGDGSANAITANNNSFDSLNYGFYSVGSNTVGSLSASSNTFESCYYAFYLEGIYTTTVDSNTINNSSYAIYSFYNHFSTFTGNKINSPVYAGFYVGLNKSGQTPVTMTNNTIANVGSGYYGMYLIGFAKAFNNTISGASGASTGIYLYNINHTNSSFVDLEHNTLSGFQYGIYSSNSENVIASFNTISNIQYSAYYGLLDEFDTISGNTLKNCGLASGAYAVIYVNPFFLGAYLKDTSITGNSYTGNSKNLSYYIYVNGHWYNANISGNTTNTMLPTYPQYGD
ncbi:MAG TPA: right-handed parallel beta-helix repeat-containing protein [Drouetiella sp.]